MQRSLLGTRLVAILCAFFATATFAATTPSAATLTPSSPTVTFTGGPFPVSNPSSPTSDNPPACVDQTCGIIAVTVSIPASDFNSYKARLSVGWVSSGTTTQQGTKSDFDVYIYSPDLTGTQTAKASTSTDNPEQTSFPVANATYRIYVVPYDVSPTVTFTGSLTLEQNNGVGGINWGPNLGNTTVPAGTPRFYNYYAPPGVGDSAGEPSIGVNRKTEKVFGGIPNGGTVNYFGGFLPYMLSVTFDDRTGPATTTWKQVPLVLANAPRVYGDPILFTDRDTGRTFVTQELGLTPLGSTMEFTDNDDSPFTPSTGSGAPSGIDHETVGGGPYHAPVPTGVNPLYPNGVWYCSQALAYAVCSISLDGGITFGPAVPMYTLLDCVGIHGHIKIARDGTAYVPNEQCGDTQGLIVSENNGATWDVRHVTTSTPGDRDPAVGVADDGTVYFAYMNSDGHPHVAVSHDKGLNWVNDTDVGAPLGIQNSVFHAAVGGDGNRAAVAFFGSQTGGAYAQPDFPGTWYLFIATTFDGGAHWTIQNATPGDPVQRAGICDGGACRNHLDFFDMNIDKQGRVLVGYTDGCIGANCIIGTRAFGLASPNDYTAKAVIARQASGLRMYSQFDNQAGTDITPPIPTPTQPPALVTCDSVVATDATGDAVHPLLDHNAGANEQVDLTSVAFAVSPDKTTLSTTLTVKNLTLQPITGSLGTFYYVTWTSAKKKSDGTTATRTYATRAEVQASGAVVYRFGQYDQAEDTFVGTSTLVTGSVVTGPNGTITVNVPMSLAGDPTIPTTDMNAYPAAIEPYAVAIIHEQQVRFTMPADRAPNEGSFGASWQVCLPPAVVCIDDNDNSIAYSDNWHQFSATGASGGHFRMHTGSSTKDSVKLTINVASGKTGKITFNYATAPKGGSAEVFIDGVSKGSISFAGTTGSSKAPTLGVSKSYAGLSSGSHTFELRNMSGAVYVDGFCIENGTSTGTPSSGPGATTSSSSVPVPTSANSVSVVAEATGNLPIRVVLLDPAGLTLASSDNTSGFATLTVPVSQAGTYSLQVINLGAGPVEVWTAATPNVRR